MVVSKKYKFVFMCIPKTGSMAMEQILKPYGGFYLKGKKWARHPNQVPSKYKDYFTFCTIRNPYDRAVSLWFSAVDSWPKFKYGIVEKYGKEFVPFLNMLITPQVNSQFGGLPMISMSSFLGKTRIDRYLQFENLNKEIASLPFWKGDPPTFRKNVRQHLRPHWSSYYQNQKNVEIIQKWAKKDFEEFGYDTTIPIL